MTEITRVPLQPVGQGVLTKLWLGVLFVALCAGALVWFSLPPSVEVITIKAGSGPKPMSKDIVFVKYVGRLASGKVFDKSPDQPIIPIPGIFPDGAPLQMNGVVPGFSEGLAKMQTGGKYTLKIPAAKAYGAEEKRNPQTGEVELPANSDLTFDMEVTGIMSREEVERRISQAQAMMPGAGGPGGPGAGGPAGGPAGEAPAGQPGKP